MTDEKKPAATPSPDDGKQPEATQANSQKKPNPVAKAAGDVAHEVADGAKNAKDSAASAGHKLVSGFETSIKETQYEWKRDMEDYHAFKEHEHEKLENAKEALKHPDKMAADFKAGVTHNYDVAKNEVKKVAEEVRHPEHTVEAIKQSAVQIKQTVVDAPHAAQEAVVGAAKAAGDVVTGKTGATGAYDKEKLPIGLKVFGVLCILGAIAGIVAIVESGLSLAQETRSGALDHDGTSTIVVLWFQIALQLGLVVAFGALGERLLRNRRRLAAIATNALFVLIILGAICSIMLHGIDPHLIGYGVLALVMIALQSYIDPSLSQERALKRKLRDMNTRDEAEAGTLGLDKSGKGYITLNFFNLFWIFVVCSIIGLIMEEVVHFIFVVPGQIQDRAGLLFGPFSPIYGCGAVLMTVFLNRFHKSNVIIVFLVAGIIGGLFEAFVSVFMQYAFGAVAWDYTGEFPFPLFGGRTCVFMMCCWGLLGVVWIKLLLPLMLRIVNLIPWDWRYGLTAVCAVLMLVDAVMTLQSLDCWYERLSHDPVDTPIQEFYDQHFDDSYMANRFQSMTINPHDAVRGGTK